MPYIKVISIRNSVADCLKYIANPDKTEEQFYISSLNCSEDISVAEQEFCLTYQHYSHKNFYAPTSNNGKSPNKAFHIIQSFKAGECAADVAHQIGLEWVQSVFGKNFQAVILPILIVRISIITFVCVPIIWMELRSTAIKNLLNIFGKSLITFAGITEFVKWKG